MRISSQRSRIRSILHEGEPEAVDEIESAILQGKQAGQEALQEFIAKANEKKAEKARLKGKSRG